MSYAKAIFPETETQTFFILPPLLGHQNAPFRFSSYWELVTATEVNHLSSDSRLIEISINGSVGINFIMLLNEGKMELSPVVLLTGCQSDGWWMRRQTAVTGKAMTQDQLT